MATCCQSASASSRDDAPQLLGSTDLAQARVHTSKPRTSRETPCRQVLLLLQHVGTRSVVQRWMLFAAHRGRLAFLARAGREPSRPVGPPAALVLRRALQPLLRAARIRVLDLTRPIGAFAPRGID